MSLFLSAGCGSDSQQAAGQPGPASTPGQNSLLNVVTGRVLVGVPAANAQISAYSLRGDLLATTSAGPLGCFVLPTGLPSDFRVIARLGSETLATEVRNYDGTRRHVVINVPTSLVSLAAAGSADLGAAEAKVRRILQITPGTSLETGIEESGRADFSHLKFFLQAGSAGGTTALAQQLLASNAVHPFQLDFHSLTVPPTGVSADLLPLVNSMRANRNLRLSINARLEAPALPDQSVAPKNLIDSAADFIINGVLGSGLNSITSSAWTWAANQFHLNYGTGTTLDQITSQLAQIQQTLNALSDEIVRGQFQTDVDTVETIYTSVDTLVNATVDNAMVYGYSNTTLSGTTISNKPTDTSGTASGLLTSLGTFAAETDLETLQKYSLGLGNNTNLVQQSLNLGLPQYGLDQQPQFANFPVRGNALYNNVLQVSRKLTGYQTVTCNFLAETSHTTSTVATNATVAYNKIQAANFVISETAQQTPPYVVSDTVLADLENGVMWYTLACDKMDYLSARSTAKSFKLDVDGVEYDHWRLPTYNECQALQQRGRFVVNSLKTDTTAPILSQNGEADVGSSLRGLVALGFAGLNTTSGFDDKASIWYDHYYTPGGDYGEKAPVAPWTLEDFHEYHLNQKDGAEKKESNTTVRPFLICRTIGPTPALAPGSLGKTLTLQTVQPQTPSPADWVIEDIQPSEFPSLGAVTALGDPLLGTTATNQSLDISLTYLVSIGGPFQSTQGSGQPSLAQSATPFNATDTIAQSRIVIDLTQNEDVSCHPAFQSSNSNWPVFNNPNQQGAYLLRNATNANATLTSTINATYIGGYSPTQNRYPVTLTTNNVSLTATAAKHTLLGIQILPRNRLYSFPVTLETQTDKYTVLAFYNDQTIVDITQDPALQLKVVDALTNLPTDGATFIDDNPYEQLNLVKSKLQTTSTKNITIQASFGAATDSAAGLASY